MTTQSSIKDTKDDERKELSTLRLSALKSIINLLEARPNMVRKITGWKEVRTSLEGMGELDKDETDLGGLEVWLRGVPYLDSVYPHLTEL